MTMPARTPTSPPPASPPPLEPRSPAVRLSPRERSALTPAGARELFRAGAIAPTAGWANGHTQANLVSVPAEHAYDLLLFAQRNPKPCPVLDVTVVQVTAAVPDVHGAPVHVGEPETLGIGDLSRPDFGDPVEVRAEEIPIFWAWGVTPQAAIMASRPRCAITHSPGHMFVTDIPESVHRSAG